MTARYEALCSRCKEEGWDLGLGHHWINRNTEQSFWWLTVVRDREAVSSQEAGPLNTVLPRLIEELEEEMAVQGWLNSEA